MQMFIKCFSVYYFENLPWEATFTLTCLFSDHTFAYGKSRCKNPNFSIQQLAYAPPTIKCIADHPSDASQLNIQCQPGDIIVTATDGLFDNINENMILNEIQKLPDADEITKKGKSQSKLNRPG